MDDATKTLIDRFLSFLTTEFQQDKNLKHVQLEKYSIENFKIKIKYFYKNKEGFILVDLREIKENQNHFIHLMQNIINQLIQELDINIRT